jgi:hypothetical protein
VCERDIKQAIENTIQDISVQEWNGTEPFVEANNVIFVKEIKYDRNHGT